MSLKMICAIAAGGALLGVGGGAVAAPSPTGPGAVVKLGDGVVSAARLKPYNNAFAVTFTLADGRKTSAGIWTDQLELREIGGRKVFVRIQSTGGFSVGAQLHINVFDPVTFAPLSDEQHYPPIQTPNNPNVPLEIWTITGTHVDGRLTSADGKTEVRAFDLAAPAYDLNCCMRSLLPAALPLKAGATFTLPAIVMGEGDPDRVTYHVLRREKVRAGYRGIVEAWVVETPVPGGGELHFWIADVAPYLVRMTLTNVPTNMTRGGLHYDQSFDMIHS